MDCTAYQYQEDGFVNRPGSDPLAETNRQIAIARNNTPEDIRDMFQFQILYIKKENGYRWSWYLK